MKTENELLLGICIPTYNRGMALKKSLEHLMEVCEPNNIQIYISDNCSPDNTKDVCEALQSKHDCVHYYRQRENIGPDDNFEFVLKMAKTKYRWLMADMTFIANMDSLLNDLRNTEYDAYIANCDFGRTRFLPREDIIYDNSINLLREIGWHLTWISSMIYNQSLIEAFDFKRYKNSSFNQLALMFEPTANRKCNIKYNAHLLLAVLPLKKRSDWQSHVFDVFYRQLYEVLMSLPIYYPLSAKQECYQNHMRFSDLCSTHDHFIRYMKEQISSNDIHTNQFYIQQGGYNRYSTLSFIALFPAKFWKLMSNIGLLLRGKTQYLKKQNNDKTI